jgi:addiction module RelE/StbE family toxin
VAEIVWSRESEDDLLAIRQYISRDSPAVADRIVDELVASAERLRDFPLSGRSVEELKDEEVREIVVTPYHIAYHISD